MQKLLAKAGFGALLVGLAMPAQAATVTFSGTRFNVDAPGPAAARCGSRTTINIRQSANSISRGTSNFGNFTPTLSHCIQLPPPGPFDLGEFLFEFASGATLFGTYAGQLTPREGGGFNVSQDHIVLGGTGLFAGATGMFTSSGTLIFGMGPPQVSQTFSGTLNAPAIPEPATWGLMIAGFGLVGGSLRRQAGRVVLA